MYGKSQDTPIIHENGIAPSDHVWNGSVLHQGDSGSRIAQSAKSRCAHGSATLIKQLTTISFPISPSFRARLLFGQRIVHDPVSGEIHLWEASRGFPTDDASAQMRPV